MLMLPACRHTLSASRDEFGFIRMQLPIVVIDHLRGIHGGDRVFAGEAGGEHGAHAGDAGAEALLEAGGLGVGEVDAVEQRTQDFGSRRAEGSRAAVVALHAGGGALTTAWASVLATRAGSFCPNRRSRWSGFGPGC